MVALFAPRCTSDIVQKLWSLCHVLRDDGITYLSLPFDDESAIAYGHIRADLAAKGTPIGSNDLQIAAIPLANNLIPFH